MCRKLQDLFSLLLFSKKFNTFTKNYDKFNYFAFAPKYNELLLKKKEKKKRKSQLDICIVFII